MAVRYGTMRPNFCQEVRFAGTVRLFCCGTGTVRLFVMVRVRYVGTLFELKIPDFSLIVKAFCIERQKTAEADAECVNRDR